MKILRDESGHVLVLPFPFGRKSKAHAEEHEGLLYAPAAVAPRVEARRETAHCSFVCRWCDAPILLPHDSIGLAFGQPAARRIEARSIATVCRGCGHVSSYSLFRGCPGFDTRHKITVNQTEGKTVLLDWLRCEEGTCSHAVPLFATFEDGTNDDEKKQFASTWLWKDIHCASSHPVRPPVWLFSSRPHQFPAGLTRSIA